MNFFEHQERAKRQTRWLIIGFALAVLCIVLTIDYMVYLIYSDAERSQSEISRALAISSLGVIGLISVASLFRTMRLRAGGGKVAQELGGVPVSADERDPLRRRLRNVVEEIALASGVPVPEIYVLEKEAGINAFAAGYTPANAAIAVTRGTLEKLSREELQGVVAHEFSHILNGDMRLNIRMIGVLFGIMVIALTGRIIFHSFVRNRRFRTGSDGKGTAVIILIGLVVMFVGYIGMFFARLIKAGISRKREYLADASAVQFTRNPAGIGGALKRIAIDDVGIDMDADVEEFSHMMFGAKSISGIFATHPPIMDRILRIEPGFKKEELRQLRVRIQRKQASIDRAAEQEMARAASKGNTRVGVDFGNIIEQIGNPGQNHILYAAVIAASISEDLHSAARSTEWAREVVCLLLLDEDYDIREQQKLIITNKLGAQSLQHVEHLETMAGTILQEHRLPLAEIAFPALKRRPVKDIENLQRTISAMIKVDGKVEVFEYALARMLQQFLNESLYPAKESIHGKKNLTDLTEEVSGLLVTVARLGHQDSAASEAAAASGAMELGIGEPPSVDDNWRVTLDRTLPKLDRLKPGAKEKLIGALIRTVMHDHQVTTAEAEILRVICSRIHIPLPIAPTDTKGLASK